MTQRAFNKLDDWDQICVVHDAARAVDRALHLHGVDASPLREIVEAQTLEEAERRIAELRTPSCACRSGERCDHPFPRHFLRQASRELSALSRVCRQYHRATRSYQIVIRALQ